MDFQRKVVTYGKSSQKHVSSYKAPPSESSARPANGTSARIVSDDSTRLGKLTRSRIDRASPEATTPKGKEQGGSPRLRPRSRGTPSRSVRPSALEEPSPAADRQIPSNVFDIPSSDEDFGGVPSSHSKRRKLTTPFKEKPRPNPRSAERRQPFTASGASKGGKSPADRQAPPAKKVPRMEIATQGPASQNTLKNPPVLTPLKRRSLNNGQSTPGPAQSTSPRKSSPVRFQERRPSRPTLTPGRLSGRGQINLSPTKQEHAITHSPSRQLELMNERLATALPSVSLEASFDRIGRKSQLDTVESRKRLVDSLNSHDVGRRDFERTSSPAASRSRSHSESSAETVIEPPVWEAKSTAESQENVPSSSHDSQSTITAHSGGPRITYARQRSYLSENMLEESDPNTVASLPESLTAIPGPPKFQLEIPEEEEAGNGTVRSIHELRQAGGVARFQGLVDSIFDDIEDVTSTVSSKRSGLIQLCSRLTDAQFSQQFLDHAFEKRLANCIPEDGDIIFGFLATCANALLLSTGPVSSVTLRTTCASILRVAKTLLTENGDIAAVAKVRRNNMSKASQAALKDIRDQMFQSKIWTDSPPSRLSPQIMSLRCIEMVVRRIREKGDMMETLSETVLDRLVGILLQYSGERLDKLLESNEILVLELAFSILESYTIAMDSLEQGHEKIIQQLCQLGPLLSSLAGKEDGRIRHIQVLDIRLILNITNNNSALCEDFATPALIGALADIILSNIASVTEEFGGQKKEPSLDIVILALGALINLTEWSETSRKLILTPLHDSETTYLDSMVQIFRDGLDEISEADSVTQTHSNVVFGYLSILLSTVCLDDEVRSRIRNALPGKSLNKLLAVVDEFLHYHRKVEDELRDPDAKEDPMAGFTSRLQVIVDRIRQTEGWQG